MNHDLLSAAMVFAVAFCSMLVLWKIIGRTANKREEAMRIALDRVQGITPRKAGRTFTVKEYPRAVRRGVYSPARQ